MQQGILLNPMRFSSSMFTWDIPRVMDEDDFGLSGGRERVLDV